MAKINWRGKDSNHISVGTNAGLFDYTDVQSALDAITTAADSTAENMYVVTVAPGVYESEISHNVSHVAVVGETPFTAVLKKSINGTGGTYSIGTDTAGLAENIWLQGLIINNQLTGAIAGGGGAPPEGALYISGEDVYDTNLNWDNIHVIGNAIIGSHDGLQVFGADVTTTPGRLFVLGNIIKSCHDAFTVKGNGRIISTSNQIYCMTAGDDDLLPSANDWKTTGFHFRSDVGSSENVSGDSFFESNGDKVFMDIRANIGGATGENNQDKVAGILNYNVGTSVKQIRQRWNGTQIDIDYDIDFSPSTFISVVRQEGANSNTVRVNGLQARLRQINTGVSTPTNVYGVTQTAAAGTVRVTNSDFDISNAGSGGEVCFDCGSGGTIEYNGITHNATTAQAGAGTFTKLTPMA